MRMWDTLPNQSRNLGNHPVHFHYYELMLTRAKNKPF